MPTPASCVVVSVVVSFDEELELFSKSVLIPNNVIKITTNTVFMLINVSSRGNR